MIKVKQYIEDYRESLLKRIEQDASSQWVSEVLNIIYHSDTLSDRQIAAIGLVMDGIDKEEIGRVFSVGVPRVNQILNQSYKLIADELKRRGVNE